MDRYQPTNLRPLFGIAAVAMTALTIVVTVFVPAGLSPIGRDTTTLVKNAGRATEVAIIPARIEVIGVRETRFATSPLRSATPKQPERS
jgi:hypothetical protein